MARSDSNEWFVQLGYLGLKPIDLVEVVNHLLLFILVLVVHYRSEICTITEVLPLATTQVD